MTLARPLAVLLRALSLQSGFLGGVLDERKDAAGHESRPAHRLAGARHLGDLDDAASRCDLDPAAVSCRRNELSFPASRVGICDGRGGL
jgi:hypothetical protein